jgi:hypothetical protein
MKKTKFEYCLLLVYKIQLSYATLGELWVWRVRDNYFPYKFATMQAPKPKGDEWGPVVIPGNYKIYLKNVAQDFKTTYFIWENNNKFLVNLWPEVDEVNKNNHIFVGESHIKNDFYGNFKLTKSYESLGKIKTMLDNKDSEILIVNDIKP